MSGGPRAALAVRPYRWWFIAQIVSASGLITQLVAAAWLVLHWHGNGLELALMSVAGLGPTLVLGLFAGSLVDHLDRRLLLISTQTLLGLLSFTLYLLLITGAAGYLQLLAISLASGIVNSADAPARQIYVLDLVGPERVGGAVSLYEVVLNLSRVLGPALGGALLAASGAAACVLANAISFLAPLVVLLIHRPNARPGTGDPVSGRPRRPSAIEGIRYAWSRPLLRACILLAAASGPLFVSSVLLPLLATHAFHLGSGGYGLLLGLFGAGALPGALLASSRPPRGEHVRLLAILTGLLMAVVATAPDRPILYVGMLATGTTSIWMIAAANTLVQLRTTEELRGRVMGAWTAALPGTVPVTALIAGLVADTFGARVGYCAAGGLILLAAVAHWRAYTEPQG